MLLAFVARLLRAAQRDLRAAWRELRRVSLEDRDAFLARKLGR